MSVSKKSGKIGDDLLLLQKAISFKHNLRHEKIALA